MPCLDEPSDRTLGGGRFRAWPALVGSAIALALTASAGADTGTRRCPAAAPASVQHRPLTSSAAGWGVARIRAGHPRLYVDAAALSRLKARWNDPAFAEITRLYREGSDPVSLALRYLATGEGARCHSAAAAALAEPVQLAGMSRAVYADDTALVFDWCHAALSAVERDRLVAAIDAANARREAALDRRFQWHEAHLLGFQAYVTGVLAIEGEPGATSRLTKAAAALQNDIELGNELHGDGSYKTYAYQDLYLAAPSILWSMATGQDVVRRNEFLMHRPAVLLRLLAADGRGFDAGPGDQAADGSGRLVRDQQPSPLGPLLLAGYTKDGLAQFTGELMRRRQGWGRASDPLWLALLLFDEMVAPTSPTAAGIPASVELPVGGMVNFRSAWGLGEAPASDIVAWLYVGPLTEHGEPDAGHFTVSRGVDDLIVSGANYFGSPSGYRDRWGGLSFARNTLVFSPAGADRAPSPTAEPLRLPSSLHAFAVPCCAGF